MLIPIAVGAAYLGIGLLRYNKKVKTEALLPAPAPPLVRQPPNFVRYALLWPLPEIQK